VDVFFGDDLISQERNLMKTCALDKTSQVMKRSLPVFVSF
jgi:hypothetical protein